MALRHPTAIVEAHGNRANPLGRTAADRLRHGRCADAVHAIGQTHRIVFASVLKAWLAPAPLEAMTDRPPEIQRFLDYIERSQHGIKK